MYFYILENKIRDIVVLTNAIKKPLAKLVGMEINSILQMLILCHLSSVSIHLFNVYMISNKDRE